MRRHRQPGGALSEEMVIALLLGGRNPPVRAEAPRAPVRPARGLVPGSAEREAWARFHSALAAGG